MKAKSKTSLEWEIIQQLKGAQCFVAYCQKIGKEFWSAKQFLMLMSIDLSLSEISIFIRNQHGRQ
jgi:hypothetical protein